MGQLSRKDGEVGRVINLFLGEKKQKEGRKKPTTPKPQEKAAKMFNMIKQRIFKDKN